MHKIETMKIGSQRLMNSRQCRHACQVGLPLPSVALWSFAVLVLALGCLPNLWAQDEGPLSSLQFVVLRDYNGKPVRNAAVVLHPVNSKGKQDRSGIELKTDSEGKTSFDGIPYGMLRVQVLAPGFQTYGEDFDINKPSVSITVKLKRPQGQFSVYDQQNKKPDEKQDEKKPPEQKQ